MRVTVGLPSTVSTLVGWYCSALVSQGGSVCLRIWRIGEYSLARRCWTDGCAAARPLAGSASANIAAATRPISPCARLPQRTLMLSRIVQLSG